MDQELNITRDCEDSTCTVQTILKRLRRYQTHEVNLNRTTFSEYYHLFPILKKYNDKFVQYTRMQIDTFKYILMKIETSLEKNWCNLHSQPIIPEERLIITLRFLATGLSYKNLAFSFRMGTSTICNLVRDVMDVLWKVLCPLHMPLPTKEKLFDVAQEFYILWDLPHCIGAVDGTHIRIKKPPKSASLYYNYKKFFSIVLQAVVDARCRFIAIDVGAYGHQHDSTTFRESTFFKALQDKSIQIPEDDELPFSRMILPYFLIGDGAYPLSENLLKPYAGKNNPEEKKIFNRRLSRARNVVECAFGRMAQKWQIFYTTIQASPETTELIVKTACILMNVIIDLETGNESQQNKEVESTNMCEENVYEHDVVLGNGKKVRDKLMAYFMEHPI